AGLRVVAAGVGLCGFVQQTAQRGWDWFGVVHGRHYGKSRAVSALPFVASGLLSSSTGTWLVILGVSWLALVWALAESRAR
ncbi:MAG: hypothetical protein KGK06_13955, partial [Xanthomonadaceae bacterium]|nr:hypothetical protein [Xanthomonadaceae bacterium]